MENFVQFLTNAAHFLPLIFILVLGMMLFFFSNKNKKLEQENEMTKFLVNELNKKMQELRGNTIHIEIDPKSFSTICLADNNGKEAPGKNLIRIRAVFTRHLGIKLTL